jgi:hypothetical protein
MCGSSFETPRKGAAPQDDGEFYFPAGDNRRIRSVDAAGELFSPRVPVAIRNVVVSTIAAASAAATHTTGVFICKSPSRRRPLFFKKTGWG